MSDNIALASALTKDVLKIEGAAAVQIFNQPSEGLSTGLAVDVDPVLRFAYKIDGTASATDFAYVGFKRAADTAKLSVSSADFMRVKVRLDGAGAAITEQDTLTVADLRMTRRGTAAGVYVDITVKITNMEAQNAAMALAVEGPIELMGLEVEYDAR